MVERGKKEVVVLMRGTFDFESKGRCISDCVFGVVGVRIGRLLSRC